MNTEKTATQKILRQWLSKFKSSIVLSVSNPGYREWLNTMEWEEDQDRPRAPIDDEGPATITFRRPVPFESTETI